MVIVDELEDLAVIGEGVIASARGSPQYCKMDPRLLHHKIIDAQIVVTN
jgi:hypothetical protein